MQLSLQQWRDKSEIGGEGSNGAVWRAGGVLKGQDFIKELAIIADTLILVR